MKRWILASIVIGVLLAAWSLDYRSQEQDAGSSVPPQEQCYDIVNATGVRFLLNRCTGDSWRYHSGYNSTTREFTDDASWIAISR